MPILTPEQEKVLEEQTKKIYPPGRIEELNADDSVQTWWCSRTDELGKRMLEIDRDQMRSAAESHSRWVRSR